MNLVDIFKMCQEHIFFICFTKLPNNKWGFFHYGMLKWEERKLCSGDRLHPLYRMRVNVHFTSPWSLKTRGTKPFFTGAVHILPKIMAYQFKLAEKLIILNDRGQGVLVRMNHIKKVRGKSLLLQFYKIMRSTD